MTSCKKGVFLFFDTSTLSITHRFVTEGVGGGQKKVKCAWRYLWMTPWVLVSLVPCVCVLLTCFRLFDLQQNIRIKLGIQIMDKVGHYDGKSVSNCWMFGTQAMIWKPDTKNVRYSSHHLNTGPLSLIFKCSDQLRDKSHDLPFKNLTRKSQDCRWIQISGVQTSDPHCISI